MAVFGLSDLHLHGAVPEKDMSVFGSHWKNHRDKIKSSWENTVSDADTVIVAGDISWAMKLPEAMVDLEFLAELPGTKLLVRGNHELWWHRKQTKKLRRLLPENLILLQGNAVEIGDYSFTGSRGWRHEEKTKGSDPKIWQRELDYLADGINEMKGCTRIVIMHYPPFDDNMKHNDFARLLWEKQIDMVVYGHIHGGEYLEGNINGTEYRYIAADHLNFTPVKLLN